MRRFITCPIQTLTTATDAPFPKQYYQGVEQKLINGTGNDELQWTEGATRGYCECLGRFGHESTTDLQSSFT